MTQHADERIRKLFERRRFGIHPGLTNTLKLLEAVGNPHLKVQAIHVAGTNGKGGLCHVLYSALVQANVSVGLFTSPHLLDFRERFRVDGRMITAAELDDILNIVLPPAEAIGNTFFEISTVIAFLFFEQQEVEFAVLETGMGGRLDSTNVCAPVVTAITGIALDHTDFLGNTLALVAAEKAGIIKHNVPVVVGSLSAEAQDVIAAKAEEAGALLVDRTTSPFTLQILQRTVTGETEYQSRVEGVAETARLPLPGAHWPSLLAMTCDVIEQLQLSRSHRETVDMVFAGATRCIQDGYFGRMQVLCEDPLVMLDIAHNEQSLNGLNDTLTACGWKIAESQCVFGVMADKDISNVVPLLSEFHTVITCAPPQERAMEADVLASKFPAANVYNATTVTKAIEHAMQSGRKTVICGSFFVAEQALLFFQQTKSGPNHGII